MLLTRLELFKLLRKKESYLLFTMWLIPLVYAWGFFSGSDSFTYRGDHAISCLDWLQIMFAMLYQFFIFYVFVVIIAARSLSGEIDDHSILLYVPRVNDRRRLYAAKALSITAFVSLAVGVYLMVCIASYYGLMARVPRLASGEFWRYQDSPGVLLFLVEVFLSFVLVALVTLLLCTYLKPMLCVATTSVLLIAMTVLSQVAPVAYLLPSFYMVRLLDVVLGNTGGESLGNPRISLFTADAALLFACYAAASSAWFVPLLLAGAARFRRRDL